MGAATWARRQQEHERAQGTDLSSSPYGLGWRPREMLWMAIKWRLTNRRRALVWTAPELLDAKGSEVVCPKPSADVFSFGRVCYLVVAGREPLHGVEVKNIEESLRRSVAPNLEWPDAWPRLVNSSLAQEAFEASLVGRCRPLVERCCSVKPVLRPNMAEVCRDIRSWLNQLPAAAPPVSLSPAQPSPRTSQSPPRSPRSPRSPSKSSRGAAGRPTSEVFSMEDIPEESHYLSCPEKGHPLVVSVLVGSESCSGCNTMLSAGTKRWTCPECAFDLCSSCVATAGGTPVLPIATRAGPMLGRRP